MYFFYWILIILGLVVLLYALSIAVFYLCYKRYARRKLQHNSKSNCTCPNSEHQTHENRFSRFLNTSKLTKVHRKTGHDSIVAQWRRKVGVEEEQEAILRILDRIEMGSNPDSVQTESSWPSDWASTRLYLERSQSGRTQRSDPTFEHEGIPAVPPLAFVIHR